MAYDNPAYAELDARCERLATQLLEAMAQRDALIIQVTDKRYTLGSSAVAPPTEKMAFNYAFTSCCGMVSKAELARRAFYGKADYCPDRHGRLTRIQAMATDFAAQLRDLEASAPATGRALAMAAE